MEYDDAGLIGYATVHTNPAPWTRGIGEIRINVSPAYRGKGLGRIILDSSIENTATIATF